MLSIHLFGVSSVVVALYNILGNRFGITHQPADGGILTMITLFRNHTLWMPRFLNLVDDFVAQSSMHESFSVLVTVRTARFGFFHSRAMWHRVILASLSLYPSIITSNAVFKWLPSTSTVQHHQPNTAESSLLDMVIVITTLLVWDEWTSNASRAWSETRSFNPRGPRADCYIHIHTNYYYCSFS